MILTLLRGDDSDDVATPGKLYVDGIFECDTLEDPVREYPDKVKKETCIWGNRQYRVTIDMSPKYGRTMLHVLDVPLFTGIRIHAGNDAGDTEGCILVGDAVGNHALKYSQLALGKLYAKIEYVLNRGEEVRLVVCNPL